MNEKTIKVSEKFKDELDSLGNKGESYEDIIKRALTFRQALVNSKVVQNCRGRFLALDAPIDVKEAVMVSMLLEMGNSIFEQEFEKWKKGEPSLCHSIEGQI